MPFDPIRTDEKLAQRPKRERDLDTVMLFGCSTFVATSLATFALSAWPFFVIQDVFTLSSLGIVAAMGLLPALILGAIITRRFGLPGACGFAAGAMVVAIFIYLRLQQLAVAQYIPDAPKPDYPESVAWVAPLGWLVLAATMILILLPAREYQDATPMRPPESPSGD